MQYVLVLLMTLTIYIVAYSNKTIKLMHAHSQNRLHKNYLGCG
jgi:hypothetical protein